MSKKFPPIVNYSNPQLLLLVMLRVAIGWHFMYEGLAKALQPNWTSMAYLLDSKGFLSGLFQSIAMNTSALKVVDFVNIWGLTLVGFMLIAGLWSRYAKVIAMGFLLLFYLAQPPLMNAQYMFPGEGNYLWVNKNLIELIALGVLFLFPTGYIIGVDRFFRR